MKLLDLEPAFLKVEDLHHFKKVEKIEEADGIVFVCPKCIQEKGERLGVHSIICWQPHVPSELTPGPGRWKFEGKGFEDLTLIAGSSSILLQGGCNAHFFIRNGEIVW